MPNDEKCGVSVFSRISLIILGAIGIWLVVNAIIQLIAFNQIPTADRTQLVQTTRTLAIVQLVVGIIAVLFVLWGILVPRGTLKDLIIPSLVARGEVIERKSKSSQ